MTSNRRLPYSRLKCSGTEISAPASLSVEPAINISKASSMHEETETVTGAVWLPLFWMVICASRSVGQWLNLSSSSGFENINSYIEANIKGSPVDQLVLSLVLVLGVATIWTRKKLVTDVFRDNKAIFALTFYLGVTTIWSDVSDVSIRRWIRLAGSLIMAIVLLTEPQPLQSIKAVFRRSAYLLLPISVILVKYFPSIGVSYDWEGKKLWCGIALQKNSLGHLCCVMAFFFIWDLVSTWSINRVEQVSSRIFSFIMILMALWLLRGGGTFSSTSLMCLAIGVSILVVSRTPFFRKNIANVGSWTLLTVCLFYLLDSVFGLVECVVTSLGRDMTFTDRVPLWRALIDLGLRKPLFGYGYGGFWMPERVAYIEKVAVYAFTQGHNGYLELFVEGGLVASLLLGLSIVAIVRKSGRCDQASYDYSVFRICCLVMILFANITESSFERERNLLTFVFYIISVNDKAFRNYPVAGRVTQRASIHRSLA